jgi:hypothetical protein
MQRIVLLVAIALVSSCSSREPSEPRHRAWMTVFSGMAVEFPSHTRAGSIWIWIHQGNDYKRRFYYEYTGGSHGGDKYRYSVRNEKAGAVGVIAEGWLLYQGGKRVLYSDAELTVTVTQDPEQDVERPPE